MFEYVPILKGKYFTYYEYLFLHTFFGFIILGTICLSIGKLLNRSKRVPSPTNKSYSLQNDDLLDARTDVSTSEKFSSSYSADIDTLYEKALKSETKVGNGFIWLGWWFFCQLPGTLGTFNMLIPMRLAALMGCALMLLRIRYKFKMDRLKLYNVLQIKDKVEAYDAKSRPLRSFYRKLSIYSLLVTLFLYLLFNDFCMASFQGRHAGLITGSASFSSQFTRFFQLPQACPPGRPCHVYATLPEDASTSVFINVHTDLSHTDISISYDTEKNYEETKTLQYSKVSTGIEIAGMEKSGRRNVHSFYLSNLEPDTRYYYKIIYDNVEQADGVYRTLPGEDSTRDLVIIQGGDMGNTAKNIEMIKTASQIDPDVLVIGGDVAYDNGFCTCYFAWDHWLNDMDTLNKKSGRLVPLIFATGNHDIGLDSMSMRKLKITEKGPFFMVFFPQHSKRLSNVLTINEVPALDERKSYHYHKIGKLLIFNLDSGYLEEIGNEQVQWMKAILKKYPDHIKFANYHVPIYFACKGHDTNFLNAVSAQRNEWIPIFDDYKFALAFENHEHYLKRTFPLKNSTIDNSGTIYLGNGQWSTEGTSKCLDANHTGIYELTKHIHHFWLINVSLKDGTITNTPYDINKKPILPTITQKIKDYTLDL